MSQAFIHCVRHAQGQHNVAECYDFIDPELTSLGHEQCSALASTEREVLSKVSLVLASPMTRTLHTAKNLFEVPLGKQTIPPIIAVPTAQEVTDYNCDIGSDLDDLRERVVSRGWPVDLSLVPENWNNKSLGSRFGPAGSAILARALETRRILKTHAKALMEQRNEDVHLVLVAHGSFMHYLTNDWEDSTSYAGTGWKNCELRSYTFEDHPLDAGRVEDDAWFVETEESRRKRGKSNDMYARAMQEVLFERTMIGWEDQGLPNHAALIQPVESKL